MKIKLIRFPYKDFEMGEVVDLGEEKNKSMVSLQRAVWYDPEELERQKEEAKALASKVAKEPEPEVEEPKELSEPTPKTKKKKFLQNELRDQIAEKNTEKNKGFWDKLR